MAAVRMFMTSFTNKVKDRFSDVQSIRLFQISLSYITPLKLNKWGTGIHYPHVVSARKLSDCTYDTREISKSAAFSCSCCDHFSSWPTAVKHTY